MSQNDRKYDFKALNRLCRVVRRSGSYYLLLDSSFAKMLGLEGDEELGIVVHEVSHNGKVVDLCKVIEQK